MGLLVRVLKGCLLASNVLASFKALRKPVTRRRRIEPAQDILSSAERARRRTVKKQLTNWVVLSCFLAVERVSDKTLSWAIPLYDELKLVGLLSILMWRSAGAELVFKNIIKPCVTPYEGPLDAIGFFTNEILDIAFFLILWVPHRIQGRLFKTQEPDVPNIVAGLRKPGMPALSHEMAKSIETGQAKARIRATQLASSKNTRRPTAPIPHEARPRGQTTTSKPLYHRATSAAHFSTVGNTSDGRTRPLPSSQPLAHDRRIAASSASSLYPSVPSLPESHSSTFSSSVPFSSASSLPSRPIPISFPPSDRPFSQPGPKYATASNARTGRESGRAASPSPPAPDTPSTPPLPVQALQVPPTPAPPGAFTTSLSSSSGTYLRAPLRNPVDSPEALSPATPRQRALSAIAGLSRDLLSEESDGRSDLLVGRKQSVSLVGTKRKARRMGSDVFEEGRKRKRKESGEPNRVAATAASTTSRATINAKKSALVKASSSLSSGAVSKSRGAPSRTSRSRAPPPPTREPEGGSEDEGMETERPAAKKRSDSKASVATRASRLPCALSAQPRPASPTSPLSSSSSDSTATVEETSTAQTTTAKRPPPPPPARGIQAPRRRVLLRTNVIMPDSEETVGVPVVKRRRMA